MNGSTSSGEATRLKMTAFQVLKPTCIELMSLVAQPITSSSPHTRLIRKLLSSLRTLPVAALTPSLINYTLFPITQILRQNDPSKLPGIFLEAVFELLTPLVSAWKVAPGGMDKVAWEQLWRFTVTSIGPSLVQNGSTDKGKGRAISPEVQERGVLLLSALLAPDGHHPTGQMMELVKDAKSTLMPTLFQTVTMLLEIISPPTPHLDLQLSTLKLLRTIIKTYLVGKSEVLAALLPGTISSIAKYMHAEGKALKGGAAEEALGLIGDIISLTLGDDELRRLGVLRSKLDDLSQLDDWVGDPDSPPSPAPTTSSLKPDPFPPLSASYLDFTSAQLLKAVVPILMDTSSHSSHLARGAAGNLAYGLISSCCESLTALVPHCLTSLLLLSRDDFDPVREKAHQHLRDILGRPDLQLDPILLALLTDAVNTFPRLVLSQQDDKVASLARIATAIADLTSELDIGERNPIARLLGPGGQIERWSGALLRCLEFGRPPSWRSENSTAKRLSEKGWEQVPTTPMILAGPDGESSPHFPDLPLRHVESPKTYRAIRDMLIVMGSAASDSGLHSVEYLVNYSKGNSRGNVLQAVPALWVAQQILDGVAQGQISSAEGKVSRATRKMAREVSRIIISMDTEDDVDDEMPLPDEPTEALVPVERTQGVGTIASLLQHPLKNDTHTSHETRRLNLQAQQSILSALSLSTLALTSRILSTSFRPLLLTVLYHLLSHLASPQTIIQSYADIALTQVAYNTGYAGVQNLILDNVDYVINVVSQRLTRTRLSSTAPLVLIAMIRLVGAEIVPMVHDVVDEIFDGLDDFHGYEVLASGLLAVLVALINVMAIEVEVAGPSPECLKKMDESRRVDRAPDPKADFERFGKWYEARQKLLHEEIDGILSRAPQHAWGKKDVPKTEQETNGDEAMPVDEPEPAPTRSEEVCAQIVDKSLNFMSHSSPFLRAKVLSLVARSVPVLAMGNREGDLLPLIDRSWKIILNRLDDLPYVVTEAAQLIAALCEHCGDFMARRLLDQAWPKLKSILEKQQKVDQKSALARRGGVGTESEWTVSHRLHVAILKTAKFIVDQVPVSDALLWDMMVLFRPMLDKRAHEEIQAVSMDLYKCLGQRDGDALWVMLMATLGEEKGVWEYLRAPGLDIDANARSLLDVV